MGRAGGRLVPVGLRKRQRAELVPGFPQSMKLGIAARRRPGTRLGSATGRQNHSRPHFTGFRRLERHSPVKFAVGASSKAPLPAEMEIRVLRIADRPPAVVLLESGYRLLLLLLGHDTSFLHTHGARQGCLFRVRSYPPYGVGNCALQYARRLRRPSSCHGRPLQQRWRLVDLTPAGYISRPKSLPSFLRRHSSMSRLICSARQLRVHKALPRPYFRPRTNASRSAESD